MLLPIIAAGIDAGGSHTRLLAQTMPPTDGGEPSASDLITAEGPAANVKILGLNQTTDILARMMRDAIPDSPGRLVVVAGVAGAGRTEERMDLGLALAHVLRVEPGAVEIVADVDLALDACAGPGGPGLVIIAGTGSIAYARSTDGRVHRCGGWGRLLGDEGSGYDIGRRGLAAVADALDGGPGTQLVAAATRWGATDAKSLLSAIYDEQRSPSSFAPRVLDAAADGCIVARDIIRAGTDALARRAAWAVEDLSIEMKVVGITGGLVQHASYRGALDASVATYLPGWTCREAATTPVEAALQHAIQLARQRSEERDRY